jgi:hypothetical protein
MSHGGADKDRARPLSSVEQATIAALLSQPFPGRDQLKQQLSGARAVEIESSTEHSIRLHLNLAAPRAPVETRVPVEGSANDADGVPVFALLHVVNGYAQELQIYRGDGEPIRSALGGLRWRVMTNG